VQRDLRRQRLGDANFSRVASRRAPEAQAPQARAIGPTITPKTLPDALEAETVILAVPFWEHREVAKAAVGSCSSRATATRAVARVERAVALDDTGK
jgi:predicted dinucleotide-binding enzyme